MTLFTNNTPLPRLAALAAVSLLALTGCAGTPAEPAASAPAGDSVGIEDAWIKATDDDMSAAFGTLTNDSGQAVTVVSASTTSTPAPSVESPSTSRSPE